MPTSYRQIDLLTACRAVHSACDTKDPQGNTEQLRSIHSAKPAGAGSGAASTRLLTGNWVPVHPSLPASVERDGNDR